MDNILTKSKYLIGLECPRYLWITFNQLEKIRKPTLVEEFKFKEGDKIGGLARKLFPHGINNIWINMRETVCSISSGGV